MDTDNIRLNVLRNALYHTSRRRHFERLARIFNLIVILLGAVTISDMLATFGITQAWVGVAVTLVAALHLVLDFGGQARTHQQLQRDYYRLLAEIETNATPTPVDEARWRGAMLMIAAEEPPVFRAIDCKAYNDALAALEAFPQDQRIAIPWYHTALGGLFSFEGYNYRKVAEVRV